MKILIVHYHLLPGGVTRIVESQVKSLLPYLAPERIKVICAEADELSLPDGVELVFEPDFGYLPKDVDNKATTALLHRIQATLSRHVDDGTVVHAHNLNLGKNPVLTYAISDLANSGVSVFNHCHDFAEDRPENLAFLERVIAGQFSSDLEHVMYPRHARMRYGVLNSADRERLLGMGIPKEHVHFVPNPVHFPTSSADLTSRRQVCEVLGIRPNLPIFTYPVRVIRRKNIGEFILLSVLLRDKANWVVTMRPRNPEEVRPYEDWKRFCRQYELKLVFEAGEKVGFMDLMTHTDTCVTTSVKEGFGMAFLEPWTFGHPVVGRNLPMVTEDFVASGLALNGVYDALLVPSADGIVDFADMSAADQQDYILTVKSNHLLRSQIVRTNQVLDWDRLEMVRKDVEHNQKIIKRDYSLVSYGEKLNEVYQRLVGAPE